MRTSGFLFLLVVFSVVASVVLPPYVTDILRPDVFVILMVFLALRVPRRRALSLCWFTGLARDLVSSGPLGGSALLYLIAAWLVLRLRSETESRPVLSYVPYAFVISFAVGLVWLVTGALSSGVHPAMGNLYVLLMSSLATAAVMPLCAWVLDRSSRWLGIRRRTPFGSV